MMRKTRGFIFLLLLAAPRPVLALRSTEDLQYWAPLFLHAPPAGPLSTSLEINPRLRGDLGRLNQLLLRPTVTWALTPSFSLGGGYAWVRNDLGSRVLDEHRAWQQALLSGRAAGVTLQARGRLEQRWLENAQGGSWRARLLGRLERPLRGGPWYLALSNEYFQTLASGRNGPPEGADQNRAFVGAGRRGSGRRRVEAGYQHWWLRRPHAPDTVFHVLVLTTHWSAS